VHSPPSTNRQHLPFVAGSQGSWQHKTMEKGGLFRHLRQFRAHCFDTKKSTEKLKISSCLSEVLPIMVLFCKYSVSIYMRIGQNRLKRHQFCPGLRRQHSKPLLLAMFWKRCLRRDTRKVVFSRWKEPEQSQSRRNAINEM